MKHEDLFQQRLYEQEWRKRKRFSFSILLFLLACIVFFQVGSWFFHHDPVAKILQPVDEFFTIIDSIDGGDINDLTDRFEIIDDFSTYLSSGVTVLDTIRKRPFYFFRRGIDKGTGRMKIDTIRDTIYMEEIQVEDPDILSIFSQKRTANVIIRQGEWNADKVRTKLKKAKRYTKNSERAILYIEKYKEEAQKHEKKYGVPASVKMAQALLEGNAGASALAQQANNHFGKKCRCKEIYKKVKNKSGKKEKVLVSRTFSRTSYSNGCVQKWDDHWYDQFESYKTPAKSWEAHSALLKGSKGKGRYQELFKYNDPTKVYVVPQAWQKYLKGKKQGSYLELWAAGLKAYGYATDEDYATKLIGTMNTYALDLLPH